ncbi:Hypp2755 [Branchiostoma lanceolatum]|uniref:Hypp2755 protein n=1 Tax=Branchiostoma lanceolatum TaxID=7740 RepID=A0A8K0ERK1_BRALA|nr:Hypp2755 [Branchiostoma lanceolatum]
MENSPDRVTWPHHRLPEFSSLLRPESRAMAKPSPANRTPKDSFSPGENTQSKEAVCTPSMLPVGGAVTMRQLYMGESRSSTSSSLSDSLSDFYTSSPDVRDVAKRKEIDKEALSRIKDGEQNDGTERATPSQPSDGSSSGSVREPPSKLQPQGEVFMDDGDSSTHRGLGHPQGGTEESAPESTTDSEETESEKEFAEGTKDGVTIASHSKDQLSIQMTPDSVESNTPESPLVKDAASMEDSSNDDKAYSATFSVLCDNSGLQDLSQTDFMDRLRARVRVGSPDWSLGLSVGDVRYCTTPRPLLDGSEAFSNVARANNPSESHDTLHTPPLMVNRSPNAVVVATERNEKRQEISMMPSLPMSSSVAATLSDSCSQTTLIGGIVAGGKTPDPTLWYRRLPQPPQHVEPMLPDFNKTTIPDSLSYPCPHMDTDIIQDSTTFMWNQSPDLMKEGPALIESPQEASRTSLNKSSSAWKFTYTHPWDFSPRKSDETLAEYQAKPSSGPVQQSSVSSDLATEEHLVRMTGQMPTKTSADITQQTWSACPMFTSSSSNTLPSTMPPAVSISQPTHNNLNLLTQAAQVQAETLSSILPGQQFLVYLVPGPPDAAGTPGPPTLLYVPHTPGMAPPVIRKDIMQHGQIQGKVNNKNNKSGYLFIPVRPDPHTSAQFQTGYIGQPCTNPSQSGHSFPQVQKTFVDPTPQLYNTGDVSLPPVSTPFPLIQGGTSGELSHSCPVYNAGPTSSTYSSYMTTAPMRGNSVGPLKKPRGRPAKSAANPYSTQPGNVAQQTAADNPNPVSVRYNMIGCFTDAGVTVPDMVTQTTSRLFMSPTTSALETSLPYPVEPSSSVPDESRVTAQQVNWRQMYPGHLQPTHTKSTSLLRKHLQSKQAGLGKPQASAGISSFSGLGQNSLLVNNSSSTITGCHVSTSSVRDSSMLSQSGITLLIDAGTGAVSQASPAAQAVERAPTATVDIIEVAEPTGK